MSVWLFIGVVALLASVFAALVPRIDGSTDARFALLALDLGPGDAENQASARRSASRAMMPIAALSIVVTSAGLVASGGESWSGITSLVGLVLAGVSLLVASRAGRRFMRITQTPIA